MKKILTIAILLIMAGYSKAFTESPVLYFSDLVDGPKSGWEGSATKGAAVTIWGNNFGSSRGTSYVTVGGVNLTNDSDYAEWGVTSNNARGLERITFWLNNTCSNGAGNISITVGGITSNNIPFYIRTTGNIRFVDHANGSDAYNGQYASYVSSSNGPKKTIGAGKQLMSSGDLLYIRSGTYTEDDGYGKILCITPTYNGSDNNYTAFVGYPTEFPIFMSRGIGNPNNPSTWSVGYMVFSKIKCIPTYSGVGITGAGTSSTGHIRCVGMEINGNGRGGGWVGAFDLNGSSYLWLYGNYIHNWGIDKYDHGFYIGTNDGYFLHDCYIGWNECRNLGSEVSGVYIHPKDTDEQNSNWDEVYIHDNLCYDLTHAGIHLASRMQNIYIYNNIIYNCGSVSGQRSAIFFNCQWTPKVVSNVKMYNNTIFASIANYGMVMRETGNVAMKNNIIYAPSGTSYFSGTGGTFTSDYDLYYGNGAPSSWATHALNLDPQFYNAANYDFHLKETSPAKDAGTSAVNTIVTKDYDGVARPQGAGYDIGAYEYVSQTYHPADLNQNNGIEMRELIAFIAKWKSGQATLADVLEVLNRWLRGM